MSVYVKCIGKHALTTYRTTYMISDMLDLESIEPDNEFLSRPRTMMEFAQYVGVSLDYVYKQIAAGELVARKHSGKLVRLWPADMRAWIAKAATAEVK